MKRLPLIFFLLFVCCFVKAQTVLTPDKIYGELFTDVQMARIFPDSKTFVDCIPKKNPSQIVQQYLEIKRNPAIRFSLSLFVDDNFIVPALPANTSTTNEKNIVTHIESLWHVLKRNRDSMITGSSLLPLPYPYIVPGGRFREIYYWDTYFTMLGLKESGHFALIEDMVKNFAYLLSEYGHIPNGNRSYYLSRSQPPFFSLMVELLASLKGKQIFVLYKPALEKEYLYWMDKTAATKHVVRMPDGSTLNRYYDQLNIPRQESYYEDVKTAEKANQKNRSTIYRQLRSAAESGWDFSSRWFSNGKDLHTIETTSLVPVDLNCLLYHLEKTLSTAHHESGDRLKAAYYQQLAEKRKKAINKYLWSTRYNWYTDYHLLKKTPSPSMTLAGMFPFFLHVAEKNKIKTAAIHLKKNFLKKGGVVTSTMNTGEQWDAPNGWPPLQWITIIGLENYEQPVLAKDIAQRWVQLNKKVFNATGKLMEKYNVVNTTLEAGGGEYPSQDGFGWTNGVLLALIKKYQLQ